MRLGLFRVLEQEERHALLGGIRVEIGPEAICGVFQDRLQHPETRLAVRCLSLDKHALADERAKPLEHGHPQVAGVANGLGTLQRAPCRECR